MALLLLGVALRIGALDGVSFRSPDERVITRQARLVLEQGSGGVRALVEEYDRQPDLRNYPPPTRAGSIWLVAAAMRLTGVTDERAGAFVSCAASLGSLAVLAWFGVRFLPRGAALAAACLLAVLPPELAVSRRAWQDALAGLVGFGLVALAAAIARSPRRRGLLAAFVSLGSAGILVKELAPMAYAFVAAWLLWLLAARRRDGRSALFLVAAGAAGALVAVALLARAVGGLPTLLRIVGDRPAANAANAYALEYQTGPGWSVVQAFWIAAPAATLLAGAALVLLLLARLRLVALRGAARVAPVALPLGLFVVGFAALPALLPHWVNLRYLAVTFGPLCLLAGTGAWLLLDAAAELAPPARGLLRAGGATVLLVAAAADVHFFRQVFVAGGVPDLSLRMLREADAGLPASAATPSVAPTSGGTSGR